MGNRLSSSATATNSTHAKTTHVGSITGNQQNHKNKVNVNVTNTRSSSTQHISHTHTNLELHKLLSYSIDSCNGYIQKKCIINNCYILLRVLTESLFGYVVVGCDINDCNKTVCIKISNKLLCEKRESVRGDDVLDNVKREAAIMYHLQLNQLNNITTKQHNLIDILDETDCGSVNSDADHEILNNHDRSSPTVSLSTHNSHKNSETKIYGQLIKHPKMKYALYSKYLCKLINEIEDNEIHCLISEYCSGSDLFDIIMLRGAFNNNCAAYIFKQLCMSVKYMHSRNIAHLDLSLENLCLTNNGDIRIIDFGSAAMHPADCAAQQLAQYGCSVRPSNKCIPQNKKHLIHTTTFPCIATRRAPGKKPNVSPEIYNGRDDWFGTKNEIYDAYKADIWSLGIILYTILTGYPPFNVPSLEDDAWFRLIYTGDWLDPVIKSKKIGNAYRDVDENALQLINTILKPEHQRPSIDDILNSTWLNCIHHFSNEQIHQVCQQKQQLAILRPITLQQYL